MMALSAPALNSQPAALDVRGLRVETASGAPIVADVSLQLAPGEALGLVGESGSGKTTTVLSLLGYTQAGARITAGEITIRGEAMEASRPGRARRLRGRMISYVPQNPGTALNPSMRVGPAVLDMLRAHLSGKTASALDTVAGSALERAGLPTKTSFQQRYPHQLSGGQQQRVCIAVALVCEPPVVVLDEPTTGLDVVTQARILDELRRLRRDHGIAMLYVTHDLAVVAGFADRLAVMYAGRIVEDGPTVEVLRRPKHPYTRGLLSSIPDHVHPQELDPMPGVAVGVGEHPPGCAFEQRCALSTEACSETVPELRTVQLGHRSRCLHVDAVTDPPQRPVRARAASSVATPLLAITGLRAEHRGRHGVLTVARDVEFTVGHGECVALVGESGSGKTTIARTIVGLHPIAAGRITLGGEELAGSARVRSREQRRRVQIIFQNPSDALNPRHQARGIVARAARTLRGLSWPEALNQANQLLDLVRLPRSTGDRYPAELSGGERQRVGIARALAAEPELIVCDEITSALDVSVQAAVLQLLGQLRAELGLALLFITHDLGVVASVAERVLVLERGELVETGDTLTVLRAPRHSYTQRLLAAAPSLHDALHGCQPNRATAG
jgi:oligopeptide/dipeptide ABC transporter ATP-binding protein